MDIFILIYLSVKIYNKAQINDESPWNWVFRLVSLFVSTELVIGLLIVSYVGMDKILYAVFPSLLFAGISAFLVFQQLNRIIDQKESDRSDEMIEQEEKNKPNLDHFR